MLESKVRTPEETARYMAELKAWIHEEEGTPAEEMAAFLRNGWRTMRRSIWDSGRRNMNILQITLTRRSLRFWTWAAVPVWSWKPCTAGFPIWR